MMTSFDFRIFDRILELFEEFEFQWLWPSWVVFVKKKAQFIGDLYAYVCVCVCIRILPNTDSSGWPGGRTKVCFHYRPLPIVLFLIFTVLPKNGHSAVENICRRYDALRKFLSD